MSLHLGSEFIRPKLLLLTALLCVGCATQVIPPKAPADPVQVYLTDYGRHASIVLPDSQGGYDEYAFGDWEFFAKGNTAWPVALRAVLNSPQSTLGRRHIPPNLATDRLAEALGSKRLMSFHASRQEVDALRSQLDAVFSASSDPPIHSDYSKLDHVPSSERYWACHNCNHVTARWLRQLGCEVNGPAIFSNFRIEAP